MTEAHLEKKLVAFCREHGLLTYKFASPSHRGVPDRIIMGRGKVMFLELKRPGNKPTALQEREQRRITDCGICAWWASDWHFIQLTISDFFHLPSGI
jgi:hypothetical protein